MLYYNTQGTTISTAQYIEETDPSYIGRSFYLQDFDSDDTTEFMFNVSLTLMEAVDGSENEGLLFNTTSTGVTVYLSLADLSTIEYVLMGSNSYSAYQQVSNPFKLVKN